MANKQKNSTWDNMIKPVVVLFTICLVVSGLLAVTTTSLLLLLPKMLLSRTGGSFGSLGC